MEMTINEFVTFMAQEIVMGCDRLSRRDVLEYVKDQKFNMEELRSKVNEEIRSSYPEESWDEEFLEGQLGLWFPGVNEIPEFKSYRRTQIAEMRPITESEDLSGHILTSNNCTVSISAEDLKGGSPKMGDMVARNPKNHFDQWLVAKQYFEDNFEGLSIEEDYQKYIGKKMKGFKYTDSRIECGKDMKHFVGKVGIISEYDFSDHTFMVRFGEGGGSSYRWYPVDLALKHIID